MSSPVYQFWKILTHLYPVENISIGSFPLEPFLANYDIINRKLYCTETNTSLQKGTKL